MTVEGNRNHEVHEVVSLETTCQYRLYRTHLTKDLPCIMGWALYPPALAASVLAGSHPAAVLTFSIAGVIFLFAASEPESRSRIAAPTELGLARNATLTLALVMVLAPAGFVLVSLQDPSWRLWLMGGLGSLQALIIPALFVLLYRRIPGSKRRS